MVLFNPAPSLLVFNIPCAFTHVKMQQKPWTVPGNMQTWKCCQQQQMPQTCCAPMRTQLLYPQASWLGWSGFQSTPSETFMKWFLCKMLLILILIRAVTRAERENNNNKNKIKPTKQNMQGIKEPSPLQQLKKQINCQTKHAIYLGTLTLVKSQTFNWINPTLKTDCIKTHPASL